MKRVDIDPLTKLLVVRFRFTKKHRAEEIPTRDLVRSLYQRVYSKGINSYLVPPEYVNIKNLWDWGFIFPDDWAFQANGVIKIKEKPAIMPYSSINVPKYLKFLRPYQKECMQFLEYNHGRGIIGDDMGCISGDAKITVKRSAVVKKITLQYLYKKMVLLNSWSPEIDTYISSFDEEHGLIVYNKIKKVLFKGIKPCIKVTVKSGLSIKLTPDHEIYSVDRGWVEAHKLRKGEYVYLKRKELSRNQLPFKEKVIKIEKVGRERVYDVIMHDPHRSFAADRFIVHNCGKTVEALGWIKWTLSEGPALIVAPSVTKPQWFRAYRLFVGDNNVEILNGRSNFFPLQNKTYIINWEILQYWEPYLEEMNFVTIVADECQNMCNLTAKRTKVVIRLARKFSYFLPMSGTPITSKPRQFFPVLNLVAPDVFPSEWKFLHRYCGPKHNGFSMTYDGASNTEELYNKISGIMIRRMKRDVMKDLPPLVRTVLPLDLGKAMAKYKKMEDAFYDNYDTNDIGSSAMDNAIRTMKMFIFDWKLPAVLNWIDDFLESTGKKLVVGVWHHHVIDALQAKYKSKCVVISGKVVGKKREQALENFYNRVDICILQLRAGGVGLDGLQDKCSDAVVVELGDTPTIMDQFESRLERSGQKEPMTVTYLLGMDTIEEELIEGLDKVRENISAVVDGKATKDTNLLTFLFDRSRYGKEDI